MARKKKAKVDEVQELDTAFTSMVGQKPAPKKPHSKLMIVLLSILLAAIVGSAVWLLFSDNWLVMKDVTVAGISMNGLTKKEAKARLQQMADEVYASQTMQVTVLDTTVSLSAEDSGVQIDVNKAINAAYHCTGSFDMRPYISFTGDGFEKVVTQLGQQFNASLKPTTEAVEGTRPSLESGEEAEGQTLVLTLGTPEMGLDLTALRDTILKGYSDGTFAVEAVCSVIPPEMPTADSLYEKYLTPAVDAVMDEKTFAITPETYGYSVDIQRAAQLLAGAKYGDTLRIPFAKVSPEVTKADILATLYQDILGECSTPYSGWDDDNRNTNLRLACEKIDGIILLPGESFSYNETLGERTAANGWKPAASYVGGETVDTYGGGICQGSTTLYNCVLQADLKITVVSPHGYISSYVEPGLDAMVNWGTSDFCFVNNTNWPIRLEAYRREGKMTMRIYGTDEKDYYVKMTYAVMGSTPYETKYEEIDPENNPKGYMDGQEITSPYTGYHVVTYKNKYDKETNELISSTLERNYNYARRDRVIVKFITEEDKEENKYTE
ncbi:MAG: VanW family protein [Oscillibacter sp.]|nr:VanW family protein [Oscillibacter sp.]